MNPSSRHAHHHTTVPVVQDDTLTPWRCDSIATVNARNRVLFIQEHTSTRRDENHMKQTARNVGVLGKSAGSAQVIHQQRPDIVSGKVLAHKDVAVSP